MANVFKYNKTESANSQPYRLMVGASSEAFVLGEILKRSSGLLTKADVNSDGIQEFLCVGDATGDASTKNVPVIALREDCEYRVDSSGQIAATAIGNKYTLSTAATGITAVTTKGVAEVVDTDGLDPSTVTVRFRGTGLV